MIKLDSSILVPRENYRRDAEGRGEILSTTKTALAFRVSGFDSTGGAISSGGFLTVSSGGTITNLTTDFDDAGTVDTGLAGPILGFAGNNGLVSAPDTTAARPISLR
jgi:adhesin HecA-like repeat protein